MRDGHMASLKTIQKIKVKRRGQMEEGARKRERERERERREG